MPMRRAPPFFQWTPATQMPTPGAMQMGFESEMLAVRAMIGPAIGATMQWRSVFPAPQNYQAVAVAWLNGLQGVVHGQSVLQPLSNPYDQGS